ncbi:membrane protein [Burkholderia sp. HB1]|nr:membrane protein [Burkholderia sp. HB1]
MQGVAPCHSFAQVRAMKNDPCSVAVLGVLLTIFSVGLRLGAHADLEELLLVLRQLHPNPAVVDICEVRLLVNSRRWIDALRLLRQIDEQGYGSPVVTALQAWCLYMLADRDWRRCAAAVLRSGDPTALAIVAKFLSVGGDSIAARIAEALGNEYT